MIVPRFIAGFSGHRNLAHPELVAQSLRQVWRRLQERTGESGGVLEVYSGIAYGADTLAVETTGSLGIPVHLVLPKPVAALADGQVDINAGFAADFWTLAESGAPSRFLADEWQRTFKQIQEAKAGANGGTLRLTRGSQHNPECYYDAGLEVLHACDILVAVWNGKETRGLGGTEQMVAHARNIGLPMVLIASDTGAISEERMENFGSEDDVGCALIREVDKFSRSRATTETTGEETADQIFQRLEDCSSREAKQFRAYLVGIIIVHGLATLIAVLASFLPHALWFWLALLAFMEFCMVAWALWQARRLEKGHVHERWMKTRFAAELMRSLRNSGGLLDPLYPIAVRHNRSWRRFALTLGLTLSRERPPAYDWRAARDTYVGNRLRSPDLRVGQITYFKTKQAEAAPHFHRTIWWGSKLTTMAAFCVFGALVYKTWGWLGELHDLTWWQQALANISFGLMPIVLPLAAGVFFSLRAALDSGRRTYRYQELAERLTASAKGLEALQTEASVRRAVAVIEETLHYELVEWHLAEQQNAGH